MFAFCWQYLFLVLQEGAELLPSPVLLRGDLSLPCCRGAGCQVGTVCCARVLQRQIAQKLVGFVSAAFSGCVSVDLALL